MLPNKPTISFLLFILFFNFINSVAQLTPDEAVERMKKGINLGNTLEPPYESGWNNPPAQEYYFDLYREAGFDAIRIPVRWDMHTSGSLPYKVDESWLNRVEEVVDWGLNRGLFIILNSHHDEWIMDDYTNQTLQDRFDSIWSQVAERFRNKSDSLIFEIMNEPNGAITRAQADDLHQRVLNIIRISNPTRLVIFQGYEWGSSDGLINAAIPDDDYVIGSFHSYDPYWFGLEGQGTWGTASDINSLRNKFISVKNWSDTHGIPVILGEFGALRSCDYNSRMRHYKTYIELAGEFGFAPFAWDDGGNFRIMEREDKDWDEVKDILIYSGANSPIPRLVLNEDTTIQVNWTNKVTDNDSIFVEKRTATSGKYVRIASLPGSEFNYKDENVSPENYYYYRIIAHYNSGDDIYSYPVRIFVPNNEVTEPQREYFLGHPHAIPGTIEAEDFDKGGEGFTYHDIDDFNSGGYYRLNEGVDIFDAFGMGYQVVNTQPGEWMEYTVNVLEEGNYIIKTELACMEAGGAFRIGSGESLSDTIIALSSENWVTTATTTGEIYLNSGEQVLRFEILTGPMFNIDRMIFEKDTASGIKYPEIREISIYQNNNRELCIAGSDLKFSKIRIISITGQILKVWQNISSHDILSISELQPGIYIIKARSGDMELTRKIFLR